MPRTQAKVPCLGPHEGGRAQWKRHFHNTRPSRRLRGRAHRPVTACVQASCPRVVGVFAPAVDPNRCRSWFFNAVAGIELNEFVGPDSSRFRPTACTSARAV